MKTGPEVMQRLNSSKKRTKQQHQQKQNKQTKRPYGNPQIKTREDQRGGSPGKGLYSQMDDLTSTPRTHKVKVENHLLQLSFEHKENTTHNNETDKCKVKGTKERQYFHALTGKKPKFVTNAKTSTAGSSKSTG